MFSRLANAPGTRAVHVHHSGNPDQSSAKPAKSCCIHSRRAARDSSKLGASHEPRIFAGAHTGHGGAHASSSDLIPDCCAGPGEGCHDPRARMKRIRRSKSVTQKSDEDLLVKLQYAHAWTGCGRSPQEGERGGSRASSGGRFTMKTADYPCDQMHPCSGQISVRNQWNMCAEVHLSFLRGVPGGTIDVAHTGQSSANATDGRDVRQHAKDSHRRRSFETTD
jgi:hypothetical protein